MDTCLRTIIITFQYPTRGEQASAPTVGTSNTGVRASRGCDRTTTFSSLYVSGSSSGEGRVAQGAVHGVEKMNVGAAVKAMSCVLDADIACRGSVLLYVLRLNSNM